MAVFKMENLTFAYPDGKDKALDNLSFSVEQGEFLLICGTSGCGKTTLLRHLKTPLMPFGVREGKVFFKDRELFKVPLDEQAEKIGYVFQNPDHQIVTDKVWHELAFGLENLGMSQQTMQLRVAEMASYFGISDWFSMKVSELSGGQKQLLNLASVMAMQPEVLLLDEPLSQLDPVATHNFLMTIEKINKDLGITMIMISHHVDEAFAMADRVLLMDKGKIVADSPPEKICSMVKKEDDLELMPVIARIYQKSGGQGDTPLTVRDGRKWFQTEWLKTSEEKAEKTEVFFLKKEHREWDLQMDKISFRYEREGRDILDHFSIKINTGECYCLLGGNGSGKSTALSIMAGNKKGYRGKRKKKEKKIGYLPQDPRGIFIRESILEELEDKKRELKLRDEEWEKEVFSMTGVERFWHQHPYDLSGGEIQCAALAFLLLMKPQILLLDEPTKGMDGICRRRFGEMIKKLKQQNISIVMATHDLDFAANYADRCGLLFRGKIVTENNPTDFFSENSFYTTIANQIAREYVKTAITVEDVVSAIHPTVPHSCRHDSPL